MKTQTLVFTRWRADDMSIHSTRRGFYYQDLLAINQFLEYYLDQNLTSIFVDFEYDQPAQKSFDIRVITKRKDVLLYEVKTGDSFKNDKTLVSEALTDLINTKKTGMVSDESSLFLVVSPDFLLQIAYFESNLIALQKNYSTLRTNNAKLALAFFKERLPASLYESDNELHKYLRSISIVKGKSIEINSGERLCDLEHVIIGQIERLAEQLGITCGNSAVFQEETLLSQLMYCIHSKAGSGTDLMPSFRRVLILFLALYQTPTPDIIAGSGGTLATARQEIAQKISEFENPDSLEAAEQSLSENLVGAVISEDVT